MAAVWNIKDLRPPPHLTYEIQLSDIGKHIENTYFNLERHPVYGFVALDFQKGENEVGVAENILATG
jgi:hypothetical protein